MERARHRIADKDIIGPHADALQAAAERDEGLNRVVDPLHKDALVRDGDAGLDEPRAGGGAGRRDLAGVVELGIDPDLSGAPEAARERGGHAHGQDARHARADAHGVELRQAGQGPGPAQETGIGEQQRIAAREDRLVHPGMGLQVGRDGVDAGGGGGQEIGRVEAVLARAVAAAGRADPRDHQQHPVGKAVDEAGQRGVRRLVEGILAGIRAEAHHLAPVGEPLPEDGIAGVAPVGEREVVGCHRSRVAQRRPQGTLVLQQIQPREVDGREAVALLPGRILPLADVPAAGLDPRLQGVDRGKPSGDMAVRPWHRRAATR